MTARATVLSLVALALAAHGCATHPRPDATRALATVERAQCPSAEPWPEADQLFLADPRWRGGDAAYSVDLGGERSLWLFGDSFIARTYANRRAGLGMVHNSVALMRGRDPLSASLEFHFRSDADGQPASFFPDRDGRWYWPAHGVRDGSALLLFMYRMGPVASPRGDGFDFQFEATELVRVPNPDAEPHDWRLEWMPLPEAVRGLGVGAAVLLDAEHLFAYAVEPEPPHHARLLRWPRAALHATPPPAPQAWTGTGFGRGPPAVVLERAAMELSAHRDPASGEVVVVHSQGFGAAPVVARRAPAPQGPFAEAVPLYRPELRPGQLSYAGKAHPQLVGAPLILTHVVNSTDGHSVLWDERIYYPRFLRLRPDCTR